MASLRKRGNVWYFRYKDEHGKLVERSGSPCEETARLLAQHAEVNVAKIKHGLISRKDLAYAKHEKTPLDSHISAWIADLTAKGNTAKHITEINQRVRRLAALACGAKPEHVIPPRSAKKADREKANTALIRVLSRAKLSDLTTEAVQATLAKLNRDGLSTQTCNHWRTGIRSFSKWCWESGRTREFELRGLKGFRVGMDKRHERRTISRDELLKLFDVARASPILYRKMTGQARSLVYRLAVFTGLRYAEIASLTPSDFDDNTLTIPARNTKNRRSAKFTIPADLAQSIQAYPSGSSPNCPAFPLPQDCGAKMLRVDLAQAGIPYRDDDGLVFDFHSLRCQLATLADQAGISPRVIQRLMRHSTLDLTDRYTRPRQDEISNAVDSLAHILSPSDGG